MTCDRLDKLMYFTRRKFISIISIIPFIGISPNSKRLKEIIRTSDTKPIMIIYHDWKSAYSIINHLNMNGVTINLPGSKILPTPTAKTMCFQPANPGRYDIDAISAGASYYIKYCNLVIAQDPCKYGMFTVIRSRYTQKGEILNVFTPKKA